MPRVWRVLSFILVASVALVIGVSRFYNGVHTYNQILSGWSWGFITYVSLSHVWD